MYGSPDSQSRSRDRSYTFAPARQTKTIHPVRTPLRAAENNVAHPLPAHPESFPYARCCRAISTSCFLQTATSREPQRSSASLVQLPSETLASTHNENERSLSQSSAHRLARISFTLPALPHASTRNRWP